MKTSTLSISGYLTFLCPGISLYKLLKPYVLFWHQSPTLILDVGYCSRIMFNVGTSYIVVRK